MTPMIISKINKCLQKGITSEAEVLYILAQIRKYLESVLGSTKANDYPVLCLFGDWVLHSRLNGKGAKEKLKEYSDFFESQTNDSMFIFMREGFSLFKDLRDEMYLFFNSEGITDLSLMNNDLIYRNFIKLLCEILEDLPLVSNDGPAVEFRINAIDDLEDCSVLTFNINFIDGANKNFTMDLDLVLI